MQRLKKKGLTTDLENLDNEVSQNNKDTIKNKLGVDLQLVPPDIHKRNSVEQAIHTFKGAFLSCPIGGGN